MVDGRIQKDAKIMLIMLLQRGSIEQVFDKYTFVCISLKMCCSSEREAMESNSVMKLLFSLHILEWETYS